MGLIHCVDPITVIGRNIKQYLAADPCAQAMSVSFTHLNRAKRHGEIQMKRMVVFAWNYVFNAEVSPLRHITDVSMRHYVLQALGFMWAAAFSVAIGSYTIAAASIIGHVALIGAATITVATYATASVKPEIFKRGFGRRRDGEHE